MRIIVTFKRGVGRGNKDKCHKRHRRAKKFRDAKEQSLFEKLDRDIIEVDAAEVAAVVAEYRSDDDVVGVEVDEPARPAVIPNDPNYGGQWHHSKIGCPAAWDIQTGNANLVIAVCDTGVDSAHPDLAPNLLTGYNSDDGTTNTADIHGHGTAVAGTAAAVGNNGAFGTGVSWRAKILPVRITNDPSGIAYMSRMAAAITYAADNGAKVINLSYETYNASRTALSPTVLAACDYAASKGACAVICAGNLSMNPAGADDPVNAIYVAATDANDARASFSNFGAFIDIAAPGVNIFTTKRGNGYGSWNGTSFSAPIVAGVLALMFAANPSLTVAQARQLLFENAVPLGNADWFGAGRVNAYAAVNAAKNVVAPIPSPLPITPTDWIVRTTYVPPSYLPYGIRCHFEMKQGDAGLSYQLEVNGAARDVPQSEIDYKPYPSSDTARRFFWKLGARGKFSVRLRSKSSAAVSAWTPMATVNLR